MPWLIEHNRPFLGDPQYLRVIVDNAHGSGVPRSRIEFDKEPGVAVQFTRKDAAENFLYLHHAECVNARATEHLFVDRA